MKAQPTIARKADRPSPPGPSQAHQIETLFALCIVLSDRISTVETSNAQLRAAAGLDPPPPTIGAKFCTIKSAMYETGFSHTHVGNLIKQGRLSAIKVGGHVLITVASVEALLRAKDSFASSSRRAA